MTGFSEPGNPFKDVEVTSRQVRRTVQRESIRWIPALIAVGVSLVVVFFGIAGVATHFNYWLNSQQAQNNAHIVQQNYNTQQGYVKDITDDVQAIDANIATSGSASSAGMTAQNIHSGSDACSYAQLLVPGEVTVQADMTKWISVNCADGALTPSSSVYQGGNGS